MGSGIRLARVRGIDIKMHPSFVLALGWVVFHWGVTLHRGPVGAAFGCVLLVAVFVCVVGHELAHSFLAMRFGLAVHDITLLPMGGVARIESGPVPPWREAGIALAGPLLNLLVSIALLPFAMAALVLHGGIDIPNALAVSAETGLGSLIVHLCVANVLLALFNLLPAFPMDGGRVLRASLISRSSRVVATRIAAFLGQCLAGGLLLGGLLFHDPFLPLVAIFVLLAAWVESRMSRLDQALHRLPVGQFSVWDMGGVRPDDPLSFALRGGVRDVAVVADGVVVGMLWRESILARVGGSPYLKAREVMDRSVVPVSTDTSVFDAHQRMLATGHPAIPIVQDGNYRGIFTAERLSHVYRYLQDKPSRRVLSREIAEVLGLMGR